MLSPELTRELCYIEIVVSRRIRSMRFGQRRSPLRGVGFDFESHHRYVVGDDLRRVDWNVSARMQELYLKRHFEEKDVSVFLVADVSRSMNFSTAEYSKRMRVMQVAATLGFSALSDNCNFGFLAFSDRIEGFAPARKSRAQVWRAVETLSALRPQGQGTNWETALRFLRSRLQRMAIIFLLSDFATGPDATQLADLPDMRILSQKHDVVPIVFEDQMETNLPQGRGLLRLRSAESGHEMVMSLSSGQRRRYDSYVEQRKNELRNWFYSLGLECLFLQVREPFMDPLMELFERRRKI